MKILGIDPGTSRIGYGLIEKKPLKLLDYGVIESAQKDLKEKISDFSGKFKKLLAAAAPDLVVMEKIFFTKNRKTAVDVAQARGALLSQCLEKGLQIAEFGPMEIKLAVTGYGLADKKGVAMMVKRILGIEKLDGHDDASDAIAIAIAGVNYKGLDR